MEHRSDPILPDVEAFIAREGISATAFGLHSVNDPCLVSDLREGRELRSGTRDRIRFFIVNSFVKESM